MDGVEAFELFETQNTLFQPWAYIVQTIFPADVNNKTVNYPSEVTLKHIWVNWPLDSRQ